MYAMRRGEVVDAPAPRCISIDKLAACSREGGPEVACAKYIHWRCEDIATVGCGDFYPLHVAAAIRTRLKLCHSNSRIINTLHDYLLPMTSELSLACFAFEHRDPTHLNGLGVSRRRMA